MRGAPIWSCSVIRNRLGFLLFLLCLHRSWLCPLLVWGLGFIDTARNRRPVLKPEMTNASTRAITQPSPAHGRHSQSIITPSMASLEWTTGHSSGNLQARIVIIAFSVSKHCPFKKGENNIPITIKTCTTALCKYSGPWGFHLNSLIISLFYLSINNKYIANY